MVRCGGGGAGDSAGLMFRFSHFETMKNNITLFSIIWQLIMLYILWHLFRSFSFWFATIDLSQFTGTDLNWCTKHSSRENHFIIWCDIFSLIWASIHSVSGMCLLRRCLRRDRRLARHSHRCCYQLNIFDVSPSHSSQFSVENSSRNELK